jgi:hypothetical protein
MKRLFQSAINHDKTRIIAAVILAVAVMAYVNAFKVVIKIICKEIVIYTSG